MELIQIFGVVSAAFGGAFALWQYHQNQRWRETEFIAKESKEFFESVDIDKALRILDWEKRLIEFPNGEARLVNRDLLRGALRHGRDATIFKHDEAIIRDLFDRFFDRLGRFEQYIQTGVVSFDKVDPYFRYWGELLTGKRPELLDTDTIRQIWNFLEHYGFQDTAKFIGRFGAKPRE